MLRLNRGFSIYEIALKFEELIKDTPSNFYEFAKNFLLRIK